jgi:TonB family protein
MDALSRLVGTFLLNAAWQVALVSAAATVGDLLLRRAPARYRHILWEIALLGTVVLAASSLRKAMVGRVGEVTVITVSTTTAELVPAGTTASNRLGWLRTGIHRKIVLPLALGRVVLLLYVSFMAVLLARLVRAWLLTRRIERRASADGLPEDVAATAQGLWRAMTAGVWYSRRFVPRILRSCDIPGPVTVGARRAVIVLPDSLLIPDARQELAAALAHELAHNFRRDCLWNLIQELFYLPFAFHPLARLLKRRLAETRELACDELAAQVLTAPLYARSLVRMAHEISRFAVPASRADYTLGVFDADILEERVMKLLDKKPRASTQLAKLSLMASAVLIAALALAATAFSLTAVTGGVIGGVPGGTSGGISGGVSGGAIGGVSDGVPGPTSRVQGGEVPAKNDEHKTGSLSGIVVDSSGARIPKAEVRLVSRNNAFQKSVQSDETGNFSFDEVPVGRYTLEVSSTGMGGTFRSFEFKAEGQPPFFPFVLHPGSVTETVAVTAKSPHTLGDKATKMGPHRIRVGGAVEAAKLIEGAQPAYPDAAKSRGAQGVVVLEATISTGGGIEDLKVISSPDDDLTKASLEAVREWRYQPTLLNGDPIEVVTTVAVNFTLQD